MSPTTEDKDIYVIATKESRIIITQDDGFRKQVNRKGAGVLIIPSYLTNQQIDKAVVDFISEKDPKNLWGKAARISTEFK